MMSHWGPDEGRLITALVCSVCCKVWCENTQVTRAWNCHKIEWFSCSGRRALYCCFITLITLFLLKKKWRFKAAEWTTWRTGSSKNQTAQNFTLEWNLSCLGAALPGLYQTKQGTFSFQRPLEIFCLVCNRFQLPESQSGFLVPPFFLGSPAWSNQHIYGPIILKDVPEVWMSKKPPVINNVNHKVGKQKHL